MAVTYFSRITSYLVYKKADLIDRFFIFLCRFIKIGDFYKTLSKHHLTRKSSNLANSDRRVPVFSLVCCSKLFSVRSQAKTGPLTILFKSAAPERQLPVFSLPGNFNVLSARFIRLSGYSKHYHKIAFKEYQR